MTNHLRESRPAPRAPKLRLLAVVLAGACIVAGCRPDDDYAASLGAPLPPADNAERFPIAVTKAPEEVSIRISRSAPGLSDQQAAQVEAFVSRYRAYGESRSRLVVDLPSGSANETAAISASKDIRAIGGEAGLAPGAILVSTYRAQRGSDAPIRISFLRSTALPPECGRWTTNLADQRDNQNYENFGCAQQHNLAAMISDPSDLVTPRATSPAPAERRDVVWGKYVKGESTVATKSAAEEVSTTGK